MPADRAKWPAPSSVVVNVLPSVRVPTCKSSNPGLVHAVPLLIVIAPPASMRLPALLKFVGVMLTVPALALSVPTAAFVNVVELNVNDVPLALITPLLTTVATLELLKFIEPVALSVIPCPIV